MLKEACRMDIRTGYNCLVLKRVSPTLYLKLCFYTECSGESVSRRGRRLDLKFVSMLSWMMGAIIDGWVMRLLL